MTYPTLKVKKPVISTEIDSAKLVKINKIDKAIKTATGDKVLDRRIGGDFAESAFALYTDKFNYTLAKDTTGRAILVVTKK